MLAKWTKLIAYYCLVAIPVLTPLFYLPLTTDYYQLNKLVLFYLLTGLGLLSWLLYSIASKTIRLTVSSPLLPMVFLGIVGVAATLMNQPNSSEIWINFTGIYLAGAAFFILASSIIQSSPQLKLILMLTSSSMALTATFGSFRWNLAGSPLNLVTLILSWLPVTITLAIKSTEGVKKLTYFLISGAMISSLILNGYRLLPGQEQTPLLLPKNSGWSIAVDTLKTKLLFGTGPGRFSESFTQFKPLIINRDNLWAVNFTASSNWYLETLTTLGLTGFIGLIWLLISTKKLYQKQPGTRMTANQLALFLGLFGQIIIGLFFPFSPANWIVFLTTLGLLVVTQKSKLNPQVKDVILTLTAITVVESNELRPELTQRRHDALLPILLAIPVSIGLIFGFYNLGKIYAAEYYFKNSLTAADKNDGNLTYNLQIKTIGLAPNVDRYRIAYSNTNLALANSLAGQNNLSDQDRQTVATLIQQAIREARLATQINPSKAVAWSNLGNIYKNLVNFAQGAEEFAVAAYTRAIQLDPANPGLRLELGGLNYTTGKYDLAVSRFTEAIKLKPNFANAYYNLAYAYQKQEKWLEAYQAMQQVSALTEPDSADRARVDNELKELEAKLPQNVKAEPETGGGELTAPSPAPAAPENLPQIEL